MKNTFFYIAIAAIAAYVIYIVYQRRNTPKPSLRGIVATTSSPNITPPQEAPPASQPPAPNSGIMGGSSLEADGAGMAVGEAVQGNPNKVIIEDPNIFKNK